MSIFAGCAGSLHRQGSYGRPGFRSRAGPVARAVHVVTGGAIVPNYPVVRMIGSRLSTMWILVTMPSNAQLNAQCSDGSRLDGLRRFVITGLLVGLTFSSAGCSSLGLSAIATGHLLSEQAVSHQPLDQSAEAAADVAEASSPSGNLSAKMPVDFEPAGRYYVLGDVHSPGSFPLDGRATVLDGISAAGGLASAASGCEIRLTRSASPETVSSDSARMTLPICYREITQAGDSSTDYEIQPGDRIYVTSRPTGKAGSGPAIHAKREGSSGVRDSQPIELADWFEAAPQASSQVLTRSAADQRPMPASMDSVGSPKSTEHASAIINAPATSRFQPMQVTSAGQ
ncbi:MAG: SLBB domain-containing protein [Rubripirellula sp.]